MVRTILLLLAILAGVSSFAGENDDDDGKDAPAPEVWSTSSEHQVRIGDETVRYTATAGAMLMLNDDDEPHALFGYTAYIADALVLCAPHTPDTHRMLDRAAFGVLKPGAVLANIARGTLVDEPAMIDALASGRLAFAALDVFDMEPLPADSPLWNMENVLVSPHSASTVFAENTRITDVFCHNLPLFLEGRFDEMRNRFHRDRGY